MELFQVMMCIVAVNRVSIEAIFARKPSDMQQPYAELQG